MCAERASMIGSVLPCGGARRSHWLRTGVQATVNSVSIVRTANDIRLARSGALRLPDFVCIGAQKSGTTWLYDLLKLSPDVCLPDTKEIHYFDKRVNLRRGIRWYASHFEHAANAITGDFTPAYATLRGFALKRVFLVLPRVRAIFIARHPVERVWSALRMYAREAGKESPIDFGERWLRSMIHSDQVRLRTEYRRTVELWERALTPARVRCEPYDALLRDPASLLSRTCAFVGATYPAVGHDVLAQRSFEGVDAQAPAWLEDELFELFNDSIEWGTERFGQDASDWHERRRITG